MLPRTQLPKTALAAAAVAALAACLAAGPLAAQQEPAAEPPAAAQDEAAEPLDQYRVELIVFEYGDALAGTTEDWSAPAEVEPEDGDADGETGDGEAEGSDDDITPESASDRSAENARRDRPTAVASAQDADAAAGTADGEPEEPVFRFMPLPKEELELTDLYRRLAGTGGYEPLLHVAWQQPGYEPADARPLDLSRLAELPERLRGEARLYRSRFLHLGLELELLSAPRGDLPAGMSRPRPLTQAGNGAEGEPLAALEPDVYRLSERRKLRSGELHYYDHPRYGVLAKVTPVEAEETPVGPSEPGDGENAGADAASADTGSSAP